MENKMPAKIIEIGNAVPWTGHSDILLSDVNFWRYIPVNYAGFYTNFLNNDVFFTATYERFKK